MPYIIVDDFNLKTQTVFEDDICMEVCTPSITVPLILIHLYLTSYGRNLLDLIQNHPSSPIELRDEEPPKIFGSNIVQAALNDEPVDVLLDVRHNVGQTDGAQATVNEGRGITPLVRSGNQFSTVC